jgi:small conductance mechanosensitive channel
MAKTNEIFGIQYSEIQDLLVQVGTNIIVAIIILVAGFWISNLVTSAIRKVLNKSNTDEGLVTFLSSFTSLVLKVMVVVSAISQLGVEMTSFVALLGAAGLAIGMAFSGTLSNFAGGIMILVLKPFKVNDKIMALGEKGTVREIQIFNTYLHTDDQKVVILPNGPVANGNIINFTRQPMRRVDCYFNLELNTDIELVKPLVIEILQEEKRIDTKQKPFIGIESVHSGCVLMVVRVWTKTEQHTELFYSLNESIYNHLKQKGIQLSENPATVPVSK